MITPEQTSELKQTIGSNYTGRVLEKLAARGITGPGGKPYSQATISMVLNGTRNNDAVEAALFDLHDEKVKEWDARNKQLGIVTE